MTNADAAMAAFKRRKARLVEQQTQQQQRRQQQQLEKANGTTNTATEPTNA